KSSLRKAARKRPTFPRSPVRGACQRLRFPKALPQTPTKCSYSKLLLLVAAQRLPWYSPSILFHIMSSLEFFPPPCCHHTGVINLLAKTRYLNVSARYRLITTNRSNLTMNIWMHHI